MAELAERHLVAVWNPTYIVNAIEGHVRILQDLASRFRADQTGEEDVYVWWGKMRSVNRQSALPHLDKILALEADLRGDDNVIGRELQLYLTDYRSLYVAEVGEITADDIREDASEVTHIPAFYKDPEKNFDCWFRLLDIRRMVSDDTESVVKELVQLRNTAYHDRPVSLYGGMVDLPLIVKRPDGVRYFDGAVRDHLTGSRLWVEFDAERSGIGAVERELRENMFGDEAWTRLDPAARTFIATAEKLYRDHRADSAFDFSPVILDLAKAFEVQTNIVLRRALEKVTPRDRMVNIDGRSVDVGRDRPLMLGTLADVMGNSQQINDALRKRIAPPLARWVTSGLPAILRELSAVRNPAAHSLHLDRPKVGRLRDQYLGVGCEGELVKLANVRFTP